MKLSWKLKKSYFLDYRPIICGCLIYLLLWLFFLPIPTKSFQDKNTTNCPPTHEAGIALSWGLMYCQCSMTSISLIAWMYFLDFGLMIYGCLICLLPVIKRPDWALNLFFPVQQHYGIIFKIFFGQKWNCIASWKKAIF